MSNLVQPDADCARLRSVHLNFMEPAIGLKTTGPAEAVVADIALHFRAASRLLNQIIALGAVAHLTTNQA